MIKIMIRIKVFAGTLNTVFFEPRVKPHCQGSPMMVWDGRVRMVFQMIEMIHRDQSKPPASEETRLR